MIQGWGIQIHVQPSRIWELQNSVTTGLYVCLSEARVGLNNSLAKAPDL